MSKKLPSKIKKQTQLGMNPSTASGRLVKDILFNFIEKSNIKCFHCNIIMNRENFSIEHKIPWLDSKNPKELYFDLNNISFSHLKCNVAASRPSPPKHKHPSSRSYQKGCRCDECKEIKKKENKKTNPKRINRTL